MAAEPILIGVMSGIAGGKSTVARMMKGLGASMIEADQIAHDVLEQPEVVDLIVARWGRGVLNEEGRINRRAIADVVFAPDGEAERRWLETIIHPRVRERMNEIIELDAMAGQRVFVIDVPLLLEVGWHERCQFNVLIDTPDEIRREMAAKRGWSGQELMRREQAQASLPDKRRAATHVIVNDGSLADLRSKVAEFWRAEITPLL